MSPSQLAAIQRLCDGIHQLDSFSVPDDGVVAIYSEGNFYTPHSSKATMTFGDLRVLSEIFEKGVS